MNPFARAAASYHGIEPSVIARSDIHTGEDGVLYLTVQIPIRDEDLGPIVKRMGELHESQAQAEAEFVPDDLSLQQLRDDYAALSPSEKGKYGSFARYKTIRILECQYAAISEANDPQPSEGIGGRKVQHVKAPEQEAESELPAAVWIKDEDLMRSQVGLASDTRNSNGPEYLLQLALLTPEQRAKYAPEVKS